MASKDTTTNTAATGNINIDDEAIRKLAALMEETGLTEIEVSEGEKRIRVGKHAAPAMMASSGSAMQAAAQVPSAPAATPTAQTPGAVASPMVGTAYLRPDPTSQPYVKAGDTIAAGDTLLIIEAMKVMNPIKAPQSGKLVRIVVSDGQPVEFGEVLMIIE